MSSRDTGNQPPKTKSVNLQIDEQTRRGVYANKGILAHSRDEFILDFVSDLPPGPQIVARIITAPAHAKALLQTLQENISRYEQNHGVIEVHSRRPPTPTADA